MKLIQSYGDGTSRGRLDSDANERAPRPPRCMPAVTAEILPPENISTLGRIFCIRVEGIDIAKHDQIARRKDMLQKAFASYLQFLCRFEPAIVKAQLTHHRSKVQEVYSDVLQGAHPRLAENLALFMVTQEFVYAWHEAVMGYYPDPDGDLRQSIAWGLAESAAKQPTFISGSGVVEELGDGTQRTAPAVQQFLASLRTMLTTGEIGLADGQHGSVTAPEFLETGERWIPKVGWRVDGEVWLLPDVVQDVVRRRLGQEWRWGAKEFQTQLRGHLNETDGRNLAVKKITSIGRPRVWVLDSRVVLGEHGEAPEVPEMQVEQV